jgi:hypothetical protein
MQARDKRILNLLSEKAEKGDKQAQAVHDYLIPIFEQADKKDAINRTERTLNEDECHLEWLKKEQASLPETNIYSDDAKTHLTIRKSYEYHLAIQRYERIIPELKEKLAKMRAEYDAEYGA